MRRKWISTLVQYGIGFGVFAAVLWQNRTGLHTVLTRPNRWEYFPLAALCIATLVSMTFLRWYMLVRAQDLPFSLRDAFRLGLVGYFFNTFLPGSVGGDLLKAGFIAREQKRRTVAVSTVLIDRGVGLWGLIALTALVGGAYWAADDPIVTDQPDLRRAIRVAVLFMVVSLTIFLLLGFLPERRAHRFAQRLHSIPRLGKILAEFWRAVWLYRQRGVSIIKGLLMSMAGHVFTVLGFYFAAMTVQPADEPANLPGLLAHFVIVPAGMAFQGFFPAPGGVGGGEWIFGLMYERLGFLNQDGAFGMFLFRVCSWALGFAGFIAYMFMKRDLKASLPGHDDQSKTNSISPDGNSNTTQER